MYSQTIIAQSASAGDMDTIVHPGAESDLVVDHCYYGCMEVGCAGFLPFMTPAK